MTWNHRVVQTIDDHTPDGYFTIREVYYSDDGHIWGWTQDSDSALGETLDELREDLDRQRRACEAPVLVLRDGKLYQDDVCVYDGDDPKHQLQVPRISDRRALEELLALENEDDAG